MNKKRLLSTAVAACLGTMATNAVAWDSSSQSDISGMAYLRMPFGGEARHQREPVMGVNLASRQHDAEQNGFNDDPSSYDLMNLEYGLEQSSLTKFDVGGVDALEYEMTVNADGGVDSAPTGGVSAGAVVAGVVAVGIVGYAASGGGDNPDTVAAPPPPLCGSAPC